MTRKPTGRVVLASDKFKGSLTAPEVVAALAAGIGRVVPAAEVVRVPVADGGDGTVAAFVAAGWRRVELVAPGPTGIPQRTCYAVNGNTAVVELAAVVGLERLPDGELNPLGANTFGLGVVLAHALEHGSTDIVLGLGGSSSTDGGAGMLRALGARVLDASGAEIELDATALSSARQLEVSGLHPAVRTARFTLACDVDNPLLGTSGAAAVYGPQKGASAADIEQLERALANWARVAGAEYAELPGAGAAGGTGFGALAILGAGLRSGIEVILELLDFATVLDGAELVVTGEGSLDAQSLHGKAPIGVAEAARKAGVGAVAVAGRCSLAPEELRTAGFRACYALLDIESDPDRCFAEAGQLVERIGERLAREQLGAR